jgi:hypothetical protein
MSLGLEALFEERLEVFPAELSSILHYAPESDAAVIRSLIKERDNLQAHVTEQAVTIEQLRHGSYSRAPVDAILSIDTGRELHQLANENDRLRKDKTKLEENLRAAEYETSVLRNRLDAESQKSKCGKKKTKNAKEVAGKEGEKAKSALDDKQRHIKSEKKMKMERNEAQAAFQEQRKISEDLRAELLVERASNVHLRETEGTNSDHITIVVPVEFLIHRADYVLVQDVLKSIRISYIDRAKEWYKEWRSHESEGKDVQVLGANYMDDKKKDKLYGDLIEDGFMMTGAEHDGWRSMTNLEGTCRTAQARHNS